MGRVDSYLRLSLEDQLTVQPNEEEGTDSESVTPELPPHNVLIHFDGNLKPLVDAGFEPSSVIGDVAAGVIPQDKLEEVAALDNVVLIEGARPMVEELD